jgi:hypothetical protein
MLVVEPVLSVAAQYVRDDLSYVLLSRSVSLHYRE